MFKLHWNGVIVGLFWLCEAFLTTWYVVTPRGMTSQHVVWRHSTWYDVTAAHGRSLWSSSLLCSTYSVRPLVVIKYRRSFKYSEPFLNCQEMTRLLSKRRFLTVTLFCFCTNQLVQDVYNSGNNSAWLCLLFKYKLNCILARISVEYLSLFQSSFCKSLRSFWATLFYHFLVVTY